MANEIKITKASWNESWQTVDIFGENFGAVQKLDFKDFESSWISVREFPPARILAGIPKEIGEGVYPITILLSRNKVFKMKESLVVGSDGSRVVKIVEKKKEVVPPPPPLLLSNIVVNALASLTKSVEKEVEKVAEVVIEKAVTPVVQKQLKSAVGEKNVNISAASAIEKVEDLKKTVKEEVAVAVIKESKDVVESVLVDTKASLSGSVEAVVKKIIKTSPSISQKDIEKEAVIMLVSSSLPVLQFSASISMQKKVEDSVVAATSGSVSNLSGKNDEKQALRSITQGLPIRKISLAAATGSAPALTGSFLPILAFDKLDIEGLDKKIKTADRDLVKAEKKLADAEILVVNVEQQKDEIQVNQKKESKRAVQNKISLANASIDILKKNVESKNANVEILKNKREALNDVKDLKALNDQVTNSKSPQRNLAAKKETIVKSTIRAVKGVEIVEKREKEQAKVDVQMDGFAQKAAKITTNLKKKPATNKKEVQNLNKDAVLAKKAIGRTKKIVESVQVNKKETVVEKKKSVVAASETKVVAKKPKPKPVKKTPTIMQSNQQFVFDSDMVYTGEADSVKDFVRLYTGLIWKKYDNKGKVAYAYNRPLDAKYKLYNAWKKFNKQDTDKDFTSYYANILINNAAFKNVKTASEMKNIGIYDLIASNSTVSIDGEDITWEIAINNETIALVTSLGYPSLLKKKIQYWLLGTLKQSTGDFDDLNFRINAFDFGKLEEDTLSNIIELNPEYHRYEKECEVIPSNKNESSMNFVYEEDVTIKELGSGIKPEKPQGLGCNSSSKNHPALKYLYFRKKNLNEFSKDALSGFKEVAGEVVSNKPPMLVTLKTNHVAKVSPDVIENLAKTSPDDPGDRYTKFYMKAYMLYDFYLKNPPKEDADGIVAGKLESSDFVRWDTVEDREESYDSLDISQLVIGPTGDVAGPATKITSFKHMNGKHVSDEVKGPDDTGMWIHNGRVLSAASKEEKSAYLKQGQVRDYASVLNGDLSKVELVGFRINKSLTSKFERDDIIQSIFIPNDKESLNLEFIDGQIKYDKTYYYNINAVMLVYGTKYSYDISGISEGDLDETDELKELQKKDKSLTGFKNRLKFKVNVKPQVKMISVPMVSKQKVPRALVRAPITISPVISIWPYRGVSDKILFAFQNGTGRYVDFVGSDPHTKWEKTREFLSLTNEFWKLDRSHMVFDDAEPVAKVRFYRSTEKPKNYTDIFGAPFKRDIDVQGDGFFVDDIKPNIKYYYMAVAEGIHGEESLPSDIFEVELVDQGGVIFPLIKAIEISQKKKDKTSITFKKTLSISPSFLQHAPNRATSDLGYLEESVFRELSFLHKSDSIDPSKSATRPAYKFRVRSRKTNKVMDLNVTFRKLRKTGVQSPPQRSEVLFSFKPTEAELLALQFDKEEVVDPFENIVEQIIKLDQELTIKVGDAADKKGSIQETTGGTTSQQSQEAAKGQGDTQKGGKNSESAGQIF
tara:strand:- start:1746 stop:6164 length:4419 start_codon:yes stop_codon:yes gene_type:complete